MIAAAGILFICDGRILLLQRGEEGDHVGEWAIPGGKIEDGETAEQAAVRECAEEIGACPAGARSELTRLQGDGVDYTTFVQHLSAPFDPVLNGEHVAAVWAPLDGLPGPLHPGMSRVLEALVPPATELDIARAIRDGAMQSPVDMDGFSLFAMRVTGTGASYRSAIDEFVWRDPSIYCNEEFLARCNGLPVIYEHPTKNMLNSEEFNNRIVGTIMLPYLVGEEVWGIARIYDADTITILKNKPMSTSPGVKLGGDAASRKIPLGNGAIMLVEGVPVCLDHLAICEAGVWDKMDGPSGILSTLTGDSAMTDAPEREAEEKERADKGRKDAAGRKDEMPAWAADAFGRMMERMDAMDKRYDSIRSDAERRDAERRDAEEKEKMDAARKDAEAKAEEERVEKDRKDAEHKARLDAVEEAVKKVSAPERSDTEAAEMADAQARCDAVAMAFGKSARPPMAGETPIAYRRRLAAEYKEHSPTWKGIDLSTLVDAALPIAEKQIYADAQAAARAPSGMPALTLREVRVPRQGGGYMSEWVGDPDGWMLPFKTPIRSRVAPGGLGLKRQN